LKKVVCIVELSIFAFKSFNMRLSLKSMKKVIITVLSIVVIGMIFSSCSSGQKCAAYGEKSRYQVERH